MENPPPNSVYLHLSCGHGYALCATDRTKIDISKSPGFARLHDTLDSSMKELKVTGNFEVKQAKPITCDVEDVMWQK